MSDEYRPIEVVDLGSGEPVPTSRPPRDRTGILLTLIAVGVFLGAACSAFTAYTVLEQRDDNRVLNCFYIAGLGFADSDEAQSYDDLNDQQKDVVDQLDCDMPGR